ncbi:MAG TPA: 3-hydroxyacyl-CoA dehydrogenase NAD-binding domain-containing protein [Mycobacteriales bacterium]|jgi:3-hydroxyacyl-CoA dehydrogenase/enoyl-CoA hydratase/carnithine racemase|nr:3-hydroxyacyl-CoA dehydrogenase NAD-binding domain-containing protein [Mycobacteriales bacterium]
MAYEEVVTEAKLRWVGDIALITLDNGFDHTRPNTFGPLGLASLDRALDEAFARDGVTAVCLTGKPFVFAVGADLGGVPEIATREEGLLVGREGHRVFRRLRDSAVPTFALVNGAALGGGLEVALHCHYRTISSGAAAIALPECFLGLIPGWGGTQLLPKLIGPDKALTVMVDNALAQNKMLKGPQAFSLGIADAMFEPADFLERSLEWVASVLAGKTTVERPAVDTGEAWTAAVERVRAGLDARLHGAAPAPYRALHLVELARTADLAEGFAAEDEALADLIFSEELRSGLYAFDLTQKRAKRPVGAPKEGARPVTKVGVVGAGLMASQLGLLFVQRLEVPVVLTDVDQARVDKGVGWIHEQLDGLLTKGRINADKAARLKGLVTGSLSKDAFRDADFVIEAVFEELKVKQQVFAECEEVVRPDCVLATNTSSLSVTQMASRLQHPERVVGFHFFNPVAVLPLLEIVRAERTDDATLATAFAVAKTLKKSAVLVKDAPAFVVNRLLTRFMGEVTKAVDEGTPFEVADHALDRLGLPMSPFLLLALVGPAVALHVAETMHEAFPERYYVSANLGRLVAAGKPGIYTWGPEGQQVDPEVAAMFSPPADATPLTADEVADRALAAMAEEIRLMLDDGVVAEAQDVDLCLLLGAGWPFHLGGITPYLDRTGVSEHVTGQRFLPKGVASLA